MKNYINNIGVGGWSLFLMIISLISHIIYAFVYGSPTHVSDDNLRGIFVKGYMWSLFGMFFSIVFCVVSLVIIKERGINKLMAIITSGIFLVLIACYVLGILPHNFFVYF